MRGKKRKGIHFSGEGKRLNLENRERQKRREKKWIREGRGKIVIKRRKKRRERL